MTEETELTEEEVLGRLEQLGKATGGDVCELCGEGGVEMDFTCLMPLRTLDGETMRLMVRGLICLQCYGSADGDMEIAIRLLKGRAEAMRQAEGKDD